MCYFFSIYLMNYELKYFIIVDCLLEEWILKMDMLVVLTTAKDT